MLTFDPVLHAYYYEGKLLDAVSDRVKNFHIPFDNNKAYGTAKKLNITKEEVLKIWERKRDVAAAKGTRVHAAVEAYLKTGETCLADPEAISGLQFLRDFQVKENLVASEKRVLHVRYGYAGTLDLLFTYKGKLILADFKTNENLTKNYGDKMLHIYSDLVASPLNKYQVQLDLYELALREEKIKVSERWIIWLTASRYEVIKLKSRATKLNSFYKPKYEDRRTNRNTANNRKSSQK